jgi:hypothetical protein
VVSRFTMPSTNDISITDPLPIVFISDKFSIIDMFMIAHGPQFRPIGALYLLYSINDNFN